MRKFFSVLMVVFFVVPITAQALTLREKINDAYAKAEQVFPDVGLLHKNFRAVGMLNSLGVVKGYSDGTFKPNNSINRAEITKMLVETMARGTDVTTAGTYKNCFSDVKEEWFAPYVCYAKEKNWVGGYPDGTFKPGNPVNRVEAMKIILNAMIPEAYWPSPTDAELALEKPLDVEQGAWYGAYVAFSLAKDLLDKQHVTITADGYNFKPAEPMSRKEVAEMIYRISLYMMERLEYVNTIADVACLKLANPTMSDTELQTKWEADLAASGDMTAADADALAGIYENDDVLAQMAADKVSTTCGGDTTKDISKWEFFITQYSVEL